MKEKVIMIQTSFHIYKLVWISNIIQLCKDFQSSGDKYLPVWSKYSIKRETSQSLSEIFLMVTSSVDVC